MLLSSQERLDDASYLQHLQRQQVLLLSQIARAAKCFNSVVNEHRILKAEIQALDVLTQVNTEA